MKSSDLLSGRQSEDYGVPKDRMADGWMLLGVFGEMILVEDCLKHRLRVG